MGPLDLLAGLVLESGARWGEVASDHQRADAVAVLTGEDRRRHWLGRSRGYSKTTDVAGMSVVALLEQLPSGAAGFAVAADKDQARLIVDAIRGFVARTPELRGAFVVDAYKVAAPRRSTALEVLAADGASAWGLLPAWLVIDELCQWPATANARTVYEALTTGLVKVKGSRSVVMTTAGDPGHWSRKVYEQALKSKLWRVSEVHGPSPWQDPVELEEERARLTESSWLRLFENRWASPEDRLTTLDSLRACVSLDGPQDPVAGHRYAIGLDVGLVNDATVAAVCHVDGPVESRRVVLDRLQVWQGRKGAAVDLDSVEAWLEEASHTYERAPVVFDPFQSVQLTQRLRRRGVRCVEFTFSATSVGRLGLTLYQLLKSGRLALPDDEALLTELANVRLRESSPGVYRLDHDAGKHDDRAVSVALAAQHLLAAVEVRGPRMRVHLPAAAAGAPVMQARWH